MKPTHLYNGNPVELIQKTYIWNAFQYCTILMVNKTGNLQKQTVQLNKLIPIINNTP